MMVVTHVKLFEFVVYVLCLLLIWRIKFFLYLSWSVVLAAKPQKLRAFTCRNTQFLHFFEDVSSRAIPIFPVWRLKTATYGRRSSAVLSISSKDNDCDLSINLLI